MKTVETGFLCCELPAQCGQAVMGMDDLGIKGKCSNKRVSRVYGRVLGGGTGSLEEVTSWWISKDN